MRPDQDLMQRLTAADPVRDAERPTPAQQQEADALLARLLATPVSPARARRPRVRRWALVAAGAVSAVAVAVAMIDVLGSDAPGPGVVERAIAAVTRDDVVYHVVERTRIRDVTVGPGAYRRDETRYQESWHAPDGRMHTKLFAPRGHRRGRLEMEIAGKWPRGRARKGFGPALFYDARRNTLRRSALGPAPGLDRSPRLDPYRDPGARLRELQQQGRLRVAGRTRVVSRDAYRLVSGPFRLGRGAVDRVEYLVDSRTYLPLVMRESTRVDYYEAERRSELRGAGRTLRSFTRFLVYEELPLDARSRAQLELDPHPGATRLDKYGRPRSRASR